MVAILCHSRDRVAVLMVATIAMDFNFIVYSSANLVLAMIIDDGL